MCGGGGGVCFGSPFNSRSSFQRIVGEGRGREEKPLFRMFFHGERSQLRIGDIFKDIFVGRTRPLRWKNEATSLEERGFFGEVKPISHLQPFRARLPPSTSNPRLQPRSQPVALFPHLMPHFLPQHYCSLGRLLPFLHSSFVSRTSSREGLILVPKRGDGIAKGRKKKTRQESVKKESLRQGTIVLVVVVVLVDSLLFCFVFFFPCSLKFFPACTR